MSALYFFWFLLNSAILWYSGYIPSITGYLTKFPIIEVPWMKFFDNSGKFYLITHQSIEVYDITEYVFALLLPLFVFNIIDHFKKPKYNKKFSYDD